MQKLAQKYKITYVWLRYQKEDTHHEEEAREKKQISQPDWLTQTSVQSAVLPKCLTMHVPNADFTSNTSKRFSSPKVIYEKNR